MKTFKEWLKSQQIDENMWGNVPVKNKKKPSDGWNAAAGNSMGAMPPAGPRMMNKKMKK